MDVVKTGAGLYQYRGVRIFKNSNGFSYWFTNVSKEYPVASKTYPDSLKNVVADLNVMLDRSDVTVENNRVISGIAKVVA
jgi:hypothetical protein